MSETLRLLIEWRDAREAIFANDKPTQTMITRLAEAEYALMQHARVLRIRSDR